ncbi:MAG: DUF1538 domain-containing protein [Clostridiales bacterium]|jgi:hypothetical protein|nr:DUF1538 domain-containing protein [Clostridiales bacterium]
MNQKLKEKIGEAFSSVLPISAIVLLLTTLLVPMSLGTVVMFVVGAALLTIGMGFFSLGAEMAMTPIGEGVGSRLAQSAKIWLMALVGLCLGIIITISEPDLYVLAEQVTAIPSRLLIYAVAAGVGIFLVIALLRVLFKISLSKMLFVFYAAVFAVSIFTPGTFLAVAFDSGGVTTGPMTVPFILALGVGIASARGGSDAEGDSFGFVALCSIGPILAVMILGILFDPAEAGYESAVIPEVETMRDVLRQFTTQLPRHFREVVSALAPIAAFFLLFQLVARAYKKRQLIKIAIGLAYTLIGLVLFLTGVDVGFIPVGSLLGEELAESGYKWLLVPVGMLIGYFIVAAEPAVYVLNRQVEELTRGAIPQKAMRLCLSIGVAVSVGLAMVRVLTGLPIYWLLVPGYGIAFLLTLAAPDIFTGIAFDSGGVASGPMTSTFLLPFVMGVCEASGGNVMTDAFGVVAMVAMTPLIAVQLMGVFYKIKMKKSQSEDEEIPGELEPGSGDGAPGAVGAISSSGGAAPDETDGIIEFDDIAGGDASYGGGDAGGGVAGEYAAGDASYGDGAAGEGNAGKNAVGREAADGGAAGEYAAGSESYGGGDAGDEAAGDRAAGEGNAGGAHEPESEGEGKGE